MRKYITIVEGMVPEVDREEIIQHMTNSVLNGSYWDVDARTKEGEPMSDDSQYDMASTWNDFEGTDYVVGHDNFKERVARWANEMYDHITKTLDQLPMDQGRYRIHRIMRLPADWQPSDGLGIYWTYDVNGADLDTSPWGHDREDAEHWLHALVEPHAVDWRGTILANMDWMSGAQELEMRLKKGAPVFLLEILDDDMNVLRAVGTTFKA